MVPWKLPLIVAAIAVPVVFGFYVGGGGVGLAVGALAAASIVVVAVRQRPRGPLGEAPSANGPRRLLVVVTCPVEERGTIERIVDTALGDGDREPAQVLVLAPARIGFLDRWASDVEAARRRAQQNLVMTVASLAKAGVPAEARVGDEDLVQAVEDQIGGFAASEVILVTAAEGEERPTASAEAELEERLRSRFERLRINGPAAG
jgi:hypothetical protein